MLKYKMRRLIALLLSAAVGLPGFSQQKVTLPGVFNPEMIEVNDRFLYITEDMRIKIFDKEDYQLFKTVGKRGEGPGEFMGFIIPYVFSEYIFVNCPGKILYFTLEGEFIREIRAMKVFGRFKPVGGGFVGYNYTRIDGVRYEQLFLYDNKFTRQKELYRRRYIRQDDGSLNLINERPPFLYIYQNHIYLDSVEGDILVFSYQGEPVKTITWPKELIPFTPKYKQRFEEGLKNNPRTREFYFRSRKDLAYPDHLPIIRMFHLSRGLLYILTSREGDGDTLEMLTVDLEGNILARQFVAIGPFARSLFPLHYTVFDRTLYVLEENLEADTWELHVTDLSLAH